MLSTFSASSTRPSAGNGDYFSHDLPPSPKVLSPIPRRLTNDSVSSLHRQPPSPILHTPALSISTAFPSSNSPGPSPSRAIPRSPYLSSRELSSPYSSSPVPRRPSLPVATNGETRNSWSSYSAIEDILSPGELVGEGIVLQGEVVWSALVSDRASQQGTGKEFEVVRKLGSGSYAVVYLVREVLSRGTPFSDDGHCAGRLDLDDALPRKSTEYGREYAIKCLSKANLDEENLEAQMAEVTIHQSLPAHPNIVTLHRTFETSAFLLLLLEFVPGEDLFYFLEQARDHYDSDPASGASAAFEDAIMLNRTPPTPSILSSLGPAQLLSRTRLKLIASMFNQMCEAVATCHDVQVFHRDIKPENFIVTDGHRYLPDGTRERKVVVKLSDFGLSTTDLESSDMDCGSAPYMSYECRNNIAPTYKPRAADVWSLGVVLINMLYHFNPWTDTADGACDSFELFRQQPVDFFLQRFTGMTQPVAEFLATRVFCIIGDSEDDSMRVSAHEFGVWIKDLPVLMCPPGAHKRLISTCSVQGHPIASSAGSRPASRQASTASAARTPAMHTRSLSRGNAVPSEHVLADAPELSTIIDQELELDEEEGVILEQPELEQEHSLDQELEHEHEHAEDCASRCQSTTRRRKRGARKGKGVQGAQPAVVEVPRKPPSVDVGTTLAMASQTLARELSKQSKLPTTASPVPAFAAPVSPVFMPGPGVMNVAPVMVVESVPVSPVVPEARPATVTKKSSRWKLGFGSKTSSERPSPTLTIPSPTDLTPTAGKSESTSSFGSKTVTATASNVSSLLMGLNASTLVVEPPVAKPPSPVSMFAVDDGYGRGRGPKKPLSPSNASIGPRPNAPSAFSAKARAASPGSMRGNNWQTASSASSTYSTNWRSSTSSAATSTSAFTRYSNGSRQSVSTVATSVSSGSWRTNASKPSIASSTGSRAKSPLGRDAPAMPPRNVKLMHGIPSELVSLPRGQAPAPGGDLFGAAAPRKARTRKKNALGPIDEQPAPKMRSDAATSTTDLSEREPAPGTPEADAPADGAGPKKVQKGQINALAKMLSALRR